MSIVTTPIHHQLAKVYREKIACGHIKFEEKFPSERELAQEHGVSRATANKVLLQMVSENLLIHKSGIGMFVAPPRSLHASLRQMDSFTSYAQALGLKPETRVLAYESVTIEQLPQPVRTGLELKKREKAIYVERLRLVDGEPVILEFRWIRSALVPGLKREELSGSFYNLLSRKWNITLEGEDHTIQARLLDISQAQKLGVASGAAALVVEGVGFTSQAPLWYQVLFYRGDRYQLESKVQLTPAQNFSVIRLLTEELPPGDAS